MRGNRDKESAISQLLGPHIYWSVCAQRHSKEPSFGLLLFEFSKVLFEAMTLCFLSSDADMNKNTRFLFIKMTTMSKRESPVGL